MLIFQSSNLLVETIKKKNLTVVAIQHSDGESVLWLTNTFGDMIFAKINFD